MQDLVAAMDSYRSEHEKTIAGKERIIENLRLQQQQNEQYKVKWNCTNVNSCIHCARLYVTFLVRCKIS